MIQARSLKTGTRLWYVRFDHDHGFSQPRNRMSNSMLRSGAVLWRRPCANLSKKRAFPRCTLRPA